MSLAPVLNPSPGSSPGRWLAHLDARPKLFVALLAGLSLWRLPGPALAVLALTGAGFCLVLGGFSRAHRRMWIAALCFVLLWSGLKIALDLINGGHPATSLAAGAELGLRLATLLLLGLTLVLSTSPHRLGLALAWFLRPVLRRRAWRLALALTLMIHFLPLTWACANGLTQGLSRRWPDCPWHERVRLISQALVRVMSQLTWKQTLAVAARGLDRPEAWRFHRPLQTVEWAAGLIPGLGLLALALIR
ncbi:MAG TPA: hypothetical protein ENN39_10510 [Desulfonatronum sp.]|nr:hypothetical protein [Desulfonatronum sp.]